MARVTIDDSLKTIPNRFTLIHIAAHRAHQLERGAKPLVAPNGDQPTVLALREIAAGHSDFSNPEYPDERS